jgi:sugar phosphate isomerase/epimerase
VKAALDETPTPARTRTGAFAIGLRRGWGGWQRDLEGWLRWVRENRFAFVDLGHDAAPLLGAVRAAGLQVGSVDLPAWRELLSADPARRADAIAAARHHIARCTAGGARLFLTAMRPEDPGESPARTFERMIGSYGALTADLERAGAAVVVEGCPGPGVLGCTPESLRALFRELPSPALAINFDPSHLLRLRIDPLRFLDEFGGRIRHMHAKDTELTGAAPGGAGREEPPTPAPVRRYAGPGWRYTIPGRGALEWTEALTRLAGAGYAGGVSVELEDDVFCGTTAGEQDGFLRSRQFLEGC